MLIEVHSAGAEHAALSLLARQRLLFALSRFAPQIESVTLSLVSEREFVGKCKSCRIELVWASGQTHPLVEDFDQDLTAAVDHAIARLERSVRRSLERRCAERAALRGARGAALRPSPRVGPSVPHSLPTRPRPARRLPHPRAAQATFFRRLGARQPKGVP